MGPLLATAPSRLRLNSHPGTLFLTLTQGTATDIIKRALADLPAQLIDTPAQIVACIHDEIILEVEDVQAKTAKQILEQVMVTAGEHYLTDVPVVVETTMADSWAGK